MTFQRTNVLEGRHVPEHESFVVLVTCGNKSLSSWHCLNTFDDSIMCCDITDHLHVIEVPDSEALH